MRIRVCLVALSLLLVAAHGSQESGRPPIGAPEFARIVREFSEGDGFFRSDNFVSNETSYLHIASKLRKVAGTGGAYIGVGPEQNFTYIAKVRPDIAFIVDIRRQALVQHLMYKAIFHLAPDRSRFLSLLLSRPSVPVPLPDPDAAIEELVEFFSRGPSDVAASAANLVRIRRTIEADFGIVLSESDLRYLDYVYGAFREDGMDIRYRSGFGGVRGTRWGAFPTLGDILLSQDLTGGYGNFLADRRDYEFVRLLQERNCVIPVNGDLAGGKALPAIAGYLRRHEYKVTAFYTSNVEQYLFMNGAFRAFAENVKRLPFSERSVIVRAYPNMRDSHPARMPGHRLTTLMQLMSVFVRDFDEGAFTDYWAVVTSDYISADLPEPLELRTVPPD